MQITICDNCPCLVPCAQCALDYEVRSPAFENLDVDYAYSENCKLESVKYDGIEFIPERREI